ncbi:hypothetical protein DXG01_002949 [Tephrocybe rancida]|nr:hypothetical protein DXG01_002949 [Tephrocybe rancida]
MSAIQAQVMTATIGIGRDAETAALSAVNALFLAGLIFSITSAFLAFLTARWLQRLSNSERTRLEITFEAQSRKRRRRRISKRDNDVENRLPGSLIPDGSEASKEGRQPFARRLVYFYFAYSLFAPMTLLVTGVMCMAMGLWVFAWAEHSLAVGIVVTAVYFIILPFPVGSQGDW